MRTLVRLWRVHRLGTSQVKIEENQINESVRRERGREESNTDIPLAAHKSQTKKL
jgi:hypothetical protein